jgi:hypothetical protein
MICSTFSTMRFCLARGDRGMNQSSDISIQVTMYSTEIKAVNYMRNVRNFDGLGILKNVLVRGENEYHFRSFGTYSDTYST